VTTVCGFHSPCHFSKAYRAQFGHAPSVERRLLA
jgi:transcriptional regulator GlxA family with amidase domain